MIINLNDGSTLTVKFHRYRRTEPSPRTVAELIYPSGSRVVSESRPHPSDQFCKATGRRMALRRVMNYAQLPREVRKRVWVEYFKQHSDLSCGARGAVNLNQPRSTNA